MPTVYVTRRAHFNAAHRLHNPGKSDEWNKRVFGKCNNPNWHGHNYVLEVTVAGEPDPETGYVIDLAELKRIIEERVVSVVDHANLNLDVDFLQGILPSTENFAVAIWRRLVSALPSGRLHRIRLQETERNVVEYHGE
jgi:6-pyruvoyltetrahydropterin/6-carboxytetrahydropterin synthase